jgi:hypothetical protein
MLRRLAPLRWIQAALIGDFDWTTHRLLPPIGTCFALVLEVAGAGPDVTIMGEDVSVRVA